MRKYILNKKSPLIILAILLFFALFYFIFFLKSIEAQVCLPLTGYLVWPGTWEAGRIPMASTSQYVLTGSPIYVSGSNVGIGYTAPAYKLQVQGDISGTRLCIGSDCRSVWPGGGIAGSGSSGQVTFWTGATSVGGDNNLFWDNTNKRLGIGTTAPQTSLHVVGNVTANTFLGTINAANVSSGQFGANTGGGNYYFMGNVGIGTTAPQDRLDVEGGSIVVNRYSGYSASGLYLSSTIGPTHYNWRITAQDQVDQALEIGPSTAPGSLTWATPTMVIKASGNVGIGTTNPVNKLDISGNLGILGGNYLRLYNSSNSAWASITFNGSSVTANYPWSFTDTGTHYIAGNVGIGTTAPGAKLHVMGGIMLGTQPGYNNSFSTDANYNLIISGVMAQNDYFKIQGTGTTDNGALEIVTGDNGNEPIIFKQISGATQYERMRIDSTGNVGIGTTAPGYKLDVSGDARVTGTLYAGAISGTYTGTINAANVSAGQFGANTGGGNYSFPGNVGIGTTAPNTKLTVRDTTSNIARFISSQPNAFLLLNVNDNTNDSTAVRIEANNDAANQVSLRFYTNNNLEGGSIERMRITGTGNVGIGTTAPAGRLQVSGGNAIFDGNVGIGTTAPTGVLHVKLPAWTNRDTHSQHAIIGSGTSGYGIRFGYNETSNIGIINVLKPFVAWGNLILQDGGGKVGIGTTAPGYKLEINGTLGYTGGTGPFCIFANACPNGWVDKGLGGYLYDKTNGAVCPYNVGGDFYSWGWCHPHICCQW